MSLRVGLIPARSKPDAQALAREMAPWLDSRGCEVLDEETLVRTGTLPDVLVTLGGDGLIMRVAHIFPDIPVLGINVGRVGFLAMIERQRWRDALTALIRGEYRIQESPTLTAVLRRGQHVEAEEWAINDVVIRSGLQMIDVEVYIDGLFVNTYPGDGMIVATPQGSTAYCMAAGGPVLAAGVGGFAVTPICAHSPIRTTLVVPEEATVDLVLATERDASLILDGAPLLSLAREDVIRVHRGDHRFRLIYLDGMNFYQAFRSKFNFLIRPDAKPTLRPPDLGDAARVPAGRGPSGE
ncbi:MAG TPA: NAD(+)/NADH kinase [Thermomicrobiaceae bacterium]|nr:NAD(+)/NADH kinase [Thermomicrobiaceae bacterium]